MQRLFHILLLGFLLCPTLSTAQELNCNVTVLTPTVQFTEKRIINNLRNTIRDFMNNTKWTTETYQNNEKIECNLLLTITSYENNEFAGTLQITSSRPIYGTTYNTTLLNLVDKNIRFQFVEFQALEYSKGSYLSDLTSILAYYAYTVIGFDYDSYIELGGTPYFNEANSIVNAAQTAAITGWKPGEKNDRNRYTLMFELLDERVQGYRKAWYRYHRKGLDNMQADIEAGRGEILKSLEEVQKINKFNPFSYLVAEFFLSKKDELIQMYKQAPASEKAKASTLLQEMDVNNANKYANELR